MTSATRRGVKSFVVCFYCNESFRSVTALFKHYCSAEEKLSLSFGTTNDVDLSQEDSLTFDADLTQEDWEPPGTSSDINDCVHIQQDSVSSEPVSNVSNVCDLGQENTVSSEPVSNVSNVCDLGQENTVSCESVSSVNNVCDLSQDNSVSSEPVLKMSIVCDLDQENSVSSEPVSNASNNFDPGEGNSLSCESVSNDGNVCESSLPGTEIECEQALSELKSNAALQESIQPVSDASEEQFSEENTNVIKKVAKLAYKKQSSEVNSDVLEEAYEKESSEANSDVVKEVADLYTDASGKQLSEASSGAEQKITEVEPSVDNNFNRATLDLVDKVLQYYEKQTNQDTPDICKSPPTPLVFQSPLPTVESSSPRHDNTLIECKKRLFPDTKCDTDGEDMIQKESDSLKHDAKELESQDSMMCSRPSSPEVDSCDMLSRSSSVGMDLDSLGCDNDPAESNDSDVCSTLPVSRKNSDELKHDHVQEVLNASKTSGKSSPDQNLNITKHGSVILKPCYVKVQDIFKSLSNPKISPKKIFGWKKKYHVCDVCSKFFRSKSDLNIHYLIHTDVKPYECDICGKSFMKECNLLAHQFSHTIKKKHNCSICKKVFPKKSLLLRHKLTHTKEKPFKCDKCNKAYSVKSSLNEHYLSHSSDRPHICEICNATFNNKRYLRKHYYHHQRKNHVCELCFKSFKHKHNLDEHYNIHVNERPNKCTICGKTFHMLLTLNKHYAVAHHDEKESFFQKRIESLVDSIVGKNPIIQKIQKSTVVDKGEKAPVKRVEKSTVVDKGEKTLVKNTDKSSVEDKSKPTVPFSSTRRKSFIPKRYLQPDSFVLY